MIFCFGMFIIYSTPSAPHLYLVRSFYASRSATMAFFLPDHYMAL